MTAWVVRMAFSMVKLRPRSVLRYLLALAPCLVTGTAQSPSAGLDQVHVMIGTAAEGQTFPATGVPFAMTQWTPQTRATEKKCEAPYYAADTRIQGFRGSHFLSGSCAQDYGSFTVMPMLSDARLEAEERSSAFSHVSEQATPYLYAVTLADSGIQARITGSLHAGMMAFRFPAADVTNGQKGWLAIENNARLGLATMHIDAARQEITGSNPVYRIYAGADQPAGFAGYIVMQFDQPFQAGGTWTGTTRAADSVDAHTVDGKAPGAYIAFALPTSRTVHVRIGTSFTSIEEARRNLAAEMPDWNFEAAVGRARSAWVQTLDTVQIAGMSADRHIFYTAMYHAMLQPRTFSDVSGTYPRFAASMPNSSETQKQPAVETADGWTYYCDFSVWDTFRGVHPLFTILEPHRDGDMVRSLIAKGEQGGFLPIFPAWNSYTTEMTGDHAGAIITDAYMKGIRGFDAEAAFRLMRKNATQEPATRELYRLGEGRRALPSYLKYGYIPLEDHVPDAFHGDEQVSRTLDYAFDDFEVSTLAGALGHTADATLFASRAQNYRKVIDPAVGFARGRHADGTWISPFDPTARVSYITESTPYVDTFFVPQDVPGLIDLLGGRAAFVKKLDGVFSSGAYDHGNEPSHQIAYLFDHAGQPALTQLHVHDIMTRLYKDSPAGLAGNDDAGQMSAWYVLSAMGFYPVTPGIPRYELGTPHFDEMSLHLDSPDRIAGRVLHIRAAGAEAGRLYVRSVRLNGKLIDLATRPWLLHSEIVAGGDLVFEMSDTPAKP
jgi:predicted alpha-1,2-mannosidase